MRRARPSSDARSTSRNSALKHGEGAAPVPWASAMRAASTRCRRHRVGAQVPRHACTTGRAGAALRDAAEVAQDRVRDDDPAGAARHAEGVRDGVPPGGDEGGGLPGQMARGDVQDRVPVARPRGFDGVMLDGDGRTPRAPAALRPARSCPPARPRPPCVASRRESGARRRRGGRGGDRVGGPAAPDGLAHRVVDTSPSGRARRTAGSRAGRTRRAAAERETRRSTQAASSAPRVGGSSPSR